MKKRGSRCDLERKAKEIVREFGGSMTRALFEAKILRMIARKLVAKLEDEFINGIDGSVKPR